MVLEKLGDSLKKSLSKITNSLFVDEKLINELVKEIQRALLQSDVNVKLVFSIGKKIKERALTEKVPTALSKKEFIVNIVYEELVKPFVIMLVGLFGNGKTTTTAKLAHYFKKRGKKLALISIDTWRPAAFAQLSQLGKSIDVPVYGEPELGDPVKIYKKFAPELQDKDIIIVDTAGRDALNEELIEELNQINTTVSPDETLLVMNADIGQSGEKQAQTFHDTCNVSGVVMTKLDGTARGGGALVACAVTGTPIKFIGVGEKIDALEEFKPEGFIGRLLGMGDLEALLDKAREAISEEDAKDMGRKMLKGEFNLLDLYQQMASMKKMGSLSKLVNLIPGMGSMNIPKDMLEGQEKKIDLWKILMDSMTKEELENPDVIRGSRLERIIAGSGCELSDLRALIKQYKQAKKLMKVMKGSTGSEKDIQKMMQKMQQKRMKF